MDTGLFIVQREAPKGSLLKERQRVEALIKKKCNVLECVRSFKEDSKDHGWLQKEGYTMDGCRGGMHLLVECSYQVPPNMSTKCVLLSKM